MERPGTVDHVIPKWVRRLVGNEITMTARHKPNRVTACLPCNGAKGLMPVAVFLRWRLDPVGLKAQVDYWSRVASRMSSKSVHYEPATRSTHHPLRDEVIAAYSIPIPEHFVTGTKAIEIRQGEPAAHRGMFLE